ncbi:TPA: hypothetical protein QDA91_001926 [Burkholderia vietnamiensis]|nr:hypothetical protein [Burkholderia vietnamiensis]
MNRPYGKPKDRYIAAAMTAAVLAAYPVAVLVCAIAACVEALSEELRGARYAWSRGLRGTIRKIYEDFLDHASGKRARRERLRNQEK